MRLDEALRQGIELLERGGVPSPRIAAEVLLLHAVAGDRALLYGHPERVLSDAERVHYARYLRDRLSGRPTQYITGHQEFWGMEFRVNPSVLIPRPETEHVVETALALASAECGVRSAELKSENSAFHIPHSALRIVDVGTGSGCIATALARELPRARIFACDVSGEALATAVQNAARLGFGGRIHFFRSDLLSPLEAGSLDLVVSNPPYVGRQEAATLPEEVRGFEPPVAVFAGEEGLETYCRLIPEAARALRPGGAVVLELGYNVAERVRALLGEGWEDTRTAFDLSGTERVISARKGTAS